MVLFMIGTMHLIIVTNILENFQIRCLFRSIFWVKICIWKGVLHLLVSEHSFGNLKVLSVYVFISNLVALHPTLTACMC